MYEISENDDVEKIRDFIENHEHLITILNEAKEHIISVFGDCVRIFLELYYDIADYNSGKFISKVDAERMVDSAKYITQVASYRKALSRV